MYFLRSRGFSSPKKNNEADSHRTEHVLSILNKVSVILICSLFISPVMLLSQTKEDLDLKKIKTDRHSHKQVNIERDIPREASKYLPQKRNFTKVSKDVNKIEKKRLNDNASKSRKNSLAKSCNAVENGNTADLKISNPRVDGDYFKFEIQIRRTNTWESEILENALGNTDFYFNRNASGFTGSPSYENLHTDLTGNNYTCTAQENEGKLQFKIEYLQQDLNFFTPTLDVYETVCTMVWEIADPTENSGVTWDQVNTGALTAANNAINLTYEGSGDINISIPVILSTFTATVSGKKVILNWATESEVENLGFILERREKGEENWEEIANYIDNIELQGQGNTDCHTEYRYVNKGKDVELRITYEYRLSNVDFEGTIEYLEIIEVTVKGIPPGHLALNPAHPNPFNIETNFSYCIGDERDVSLQIIDITGRVVKQLVNTNQAPGYYQIKWNGADKYGRQISSGVYFIVLRSGNKIKSNKLMLLK